jgi:hypothetical protein
MLFEMILGKNNLQEEERERDRERERERATGYIERGSTRTKEIDRKMK